MSFEKYYLDRAKSFEATDQEIADLKRIDEERNNLINKHQDLESQRSKRRNELKPELADEKKKLEEYRDYRLKINSEKMKDLKEERKKIHQEFKDMSTHIRDARKKQLSEDIFLKNNKIEKDKTWQNINILTREFGDLWKKIEDRYNKKKKGVKTDGLS